MAEWRERPVPPEKSADTTEETVDGMLLVVAVALVAIVGWTIFCAIVIPALLGT